MAANRGAVREVPCARCSGAAKKNGDGVCRENPDKPGSRRCQACWDVDQACPPL